ncbi:MAG: hypothetical protein HLUCCA12_01780 [Rhodobacteraceae bacterium HLUCCA12]|nr:MAG: hypothetical protein HLUCCA12_01780 [Rhodobacteraceae bacterium HLUCCA12]
MIYGILGLIVLAALALTMMRAGHDDDDDNTPGGGRRLRIPVRTNDRGPR